MITLNIINADVGEARAEWWSKSVHHDGRFGIAAGQYPVVASIDVDDRFVADEDREQWAGALILSWCRLAGCARRGVYAGVIGDETVAAVVSGMVQEPWIVVRGDDDGAYLCEGEMENGATAIWYPTEQEAQAAAERYRERLIDVGRGEGAPVERVTRAVDALNIRIAQAGDGWRWVTEQTFFSSPRRCRIVGDLAEPIY
ncbi:MAG: hypothetical protein MZV65_39315 [Chromatiales bacterium]|nr:hypothetical protein [Chromatiales bacterium]